MNHEESTLPPATDLLHAFMGNRLAWVMLYVAGGIGVVTLGVGPEAILIGLHAFIIVAAIGVFRFREQWLVARCQESEDRLRDARSMLVETGDRAMTVGARKWLEESLRTASEQRALAEAQRDQAIHLASEIAETALTWADEGADHDQLRQWRDGIDAMRRQIARPRDAEPQGASVAAIDKATDQPDDGRTTRENPIPVSSEAADDDSSRHITPTVFGFPHVAPVVSRPLYPQPLFITPADIPERVDDQRRTRRLAQEMLECNLGEVMDLSLGGMRVRTTGHHAPTEGAEVDVRFDAAEPPLSLRGAVVRSTKLGPRRIELGVRFVNVTPDVQRQLTRLSMAHRKRLTFAAA